MKEIILKASVNTIEKEKELKEFALKNGYEVVELNENEEIKVMPKDLYEQKRLLRKELVKVSEKDFLETLRDFLDTHAVEFKKNDVELPYYINFEIDSEYNDEGGTYLYMSSIHLYDENKKRVRYEFEVPTSWGSKYELEELLREEIRDAVDEEYLEEIFSGQDYIKIA